MGCQIFVCGTLSPDSESCIADLMAIFQLQDSFDGIHSINHVARSVRKRNQSHLLARDDDAVNNDRHGNRTKTNFITGTETFCTRNSLSFYPQARTVTPRYLPPSITDSVTSQLVRSWTSSQVAEAHSMALMCISALKTNRFSSSFYCSGVQGMNF